MPIFHNHKLIHIHIPKTAGTTINNALGLENLFPSNKPLEEYNLDILYGNTKDTEFDHLTAQEIKDRCTPDIWNNYTKFSVVRNPYDRLVSQYFYTLKTKDYRLVDEKYCSSFTSFLTRIYELYMMDKFDAFSHLQKNHYIPQYNYLFSPTGELLVNHVFRFEKLEEVTETLNLQPFTEKAGASDHKPYQEYYTGLCTDIVNHIYAKDFDIFGYDKN